MKITIKNKLLLCVTLSVMPVAPVLSMKIKQKKINQKKIKCVSVNNKQKKGFAYAVLTKNRQFFDKNNIAKYKLFGLTPLKSFGKAYRMLVSRITLKARYNMFMRLDYNDHYTKVFKLNKSSKKRTKVLDCRIKPVPVDWCVKEKNQVIIFTLIDGTTAVYRFGDKKPIFKKKFAEKPNGCYLSVNGQLIRFNFKHTGLKIFDLYNKNNKGKNIFFKKFTRIISTWYTCPENRLLVIYFKDRSIEFFDLCNFGKPLYPKELGRYKTLFLTGGTIKVFDVDQKQVLFTRRLKPGSKIVHYALNENANLLKIYQANKIFKLFDIKNRGKIIFSQKFQKEPWWFVNKVNKLLLLRFKNKNSDLFKVYDLQAKDQKNRHKELLSQAFEKPASHFSLFDNKKLIIDFEDNTKIKYDLRFVN
ncbi:hypothetical protein ACFLYU_05185 [Candidatus Dependentiae bacterium]